MLYEVITDDDGGLVLDRERETLGAVLRFEHLEARARDGLDIQADQLAAEPYGAAVIIRNNFV